MSSSAARDLYFAWERDAWRAGDVAVDEDSRHWGTRLERGERSAVLWAVASLQEVARAAVDVVAVLCDGAPGEEPHVFLTTQLADAARHVVAFDRWLAGDGGSGMTARSGRSAARIGPPLRRLLDESLPARARAGATARDAWDDAVAVLGLGLGAGFGGAVAARFGRELTGREILPGLRATLEGVARDLDRHGRFAASLVDRRATAVAAARDAVAGADAVLGHLGILADDLGADAIRRIDALLPQS